MEGVFPFIFGITNAFSSFRVTVINVLKFYPVGCFLVTAAFFFIQSVFFNLFFPASDRRKRSKRDDKRSHSLKWGIVHYNIRGFASLVMACALPLLSGVYPWENPFMGYTETSPQIVHVLSIYLQVQIGVVFFRILGLRASPMLIIFEVLNSVHIFLIAILNPIWGRFNSSPPGAIFVLFFYFDLIDALDSFKRSSILEKNSPFISWRVMGYLWLIFRISLPIYGTYRNGFGWFLMNVIFGIILFVQLILWAAIPRDSFR